MKDVKKQVYDIDKKRIDKKIEKEADEKSQDALKELVKKFTDDTLTGK
jgi:hypothetical protein